MNIYLKKNYKNSDWFNGNTPERLNNLKGKIKKIDFKAYRLNKDSKIFENIGGTFSWTFFFNEQAEITKEISNLGKTIIFYKSFLKNQIIKQEWLTKDGELLRLEKFEYPNNSDFATFFFLKKENGSEESSNLKREDLDADSFIYHGKSFDYLYFKNKLIERIANYGPLKFKYEYFDTCSTIITYKNEKLSNLEKFNEHDYLIEKEHYDDNGELLHLETRKYDSANNLIEKIIKTQNIEKPIHEIYIYNQENLKIEEKYKTTLFGFKTSISYEYDFSGNLIFKKVNNEIITYKYVYDENGNWVEKFEIRKSKIINKYIRVIDYFD